MGTGLVSLTSQETNGVYSHCSDSIKPHNENDFNVFAGRLIVVLQNCLALIYLDDFLAGQEIELTMHDGTVRDLCFLEDTSNKSSLLISGGAGDCKIYVTDCATGTPFQALSGHSGKCKGKEPWCRRARPVCFVSLLVLLLMHIHMSPLPEVCSNPEQAVHYHRFGASSLTCGSLVAY